MRHFISIIFVGACVLASACSSTSAAAAAGTPDTAAAADIAVDTAAQDAKAATDAAPSTGADTASTADSLNGADSSAAKVCGPADPKCLACIAKSCNGLAKAALGANFAKGSFAAPCGGYLDCLVAVNCQDTNSTCDAQITDTCQTAMMPLMDCIKPNCAVECN